MQETLQQAFQKTETLPSDCARKHKDTYRLFWQRRQSRECSTLVIVKASDLLLRLEHGLTYNDTREEVCYLRQEGLEMVAELSKTCQVALLIDFADQASTRWVIQELFVGTMRLQLDAIYCYSAAAKPSGFLLDVSQILLDFRLFSDFQQRHKQAQENPTLFVFVEACTDALEADARSRLGFNGGQVSGYTHVLLGHGENCQYKFDSLLARVAQAGTGSPAVAAYTSK